MARRSLKPQLNQIRTWVRQGRTDAWIAHQLQVAVRDIDAFKREHGLAPEGEEETSFSDDMDLRAEDDALIAAELDAEPEDDEDEPEEGETGKDDNGGSGIVPAVAVAAAEDAAAGGARRRSMGASTTARRATACGSTRRFRRTRSTPSTGRATGPSPSRSSPTES